MILSRLAPDSVLVSMELRDSSPHLWGIGDQTVQDFSKSVEIGAAISIGNVGATIP